VRGALVVCAALLASVGVACGSDDDATVATGASASTTLTSAAPVATAAAGCGGASALLALATAASRIPAERYRIASFLTAPRDPTWARLVIPAPEPDAHGVLADGMVRVVVAHCVGGTWHVINAGTSGLGCEDQVPAPVRAEFGWDCP
jgi:hypothetical protein